MKRKHTFHPLVDHPEHRHFIDYLAAGNSILSAIALFPQLFSLLFNQASHDVSVPTFLLIALNSLIWLIYGLHRKTMPLVVSSTLNAAASISILLLLYLK